MAQLIPGDRRLPASAPEPERPWTSGTGPATDEEAVELREVLAVLRRHVWLIGAVTGVVIVIAGVVLLRAVPEYRASALIRVQDERGAITGSIGGAAIDGLVGKAVDPVLSQLQVLKSRGVAAAVVDRAALRLVPQDPRFRASVLVNVRASGRLATDTIELSFAGDTYTATSGATRATARYGQPVALPKVAFTVAGPPDREQAVIRLVSAPVAVERLSRGLQATIRDKTDAVDVAYAASDPVLAQRVVNTAVQVFRELSATESQQKAQRRRIFIEEQLAQTDSALTRAQMALAEFQRKRTVFSSEQKASAQQEALMQLDMRREELVADRDAIRSLLAGLDRGRGVGQLRTLISIPSLAQNQLAGVLFSQLVRYEVRAGLPDHRETGAVG